MEDKPQPIIIKKVRKEGHGHHGGAWKVAYADFVTAMMAFFLLMWLLGSTTPEDRQGISDFFQNPSAIQGPGGASTSMIDFGGSQDIPEDEGTPLATPDKLSEEALAERIQEQAQLDELMRKLKEQIESSPTLKDFKDQLLLDITSEGLRIQIVDQEKRPMFDLGGTRLKAYTRAILFELAKTIHEVPNHISLSGHTDATPFSLEREGYSNWELSADRANAARRALIAGGMSHDQIGRVVGLASSVLFNKAEPTHPVNRRISIIVMNKATEKAIGLASRIDGAGATALEPPLDEPVSLPLVLPQLEEPTLQQAPVAAPRPEPAPEPAPVTERGGEPVEVNPDLEKMLDELLRPPA